jgi:hypothetical protein
MAICFVVHTGSSVMTLKTGVQSEQCTFRCRRTVDSIRWLRAVAAYARALLSGRECKEGWGCLERPASLTTD